MTDQNKKPDTPPSLEELLVEVRNLAACPVSALLTDLAPGCKLTLHPPQGSGGSVEIGPNAVLQFSLFLKRLLVVQATYPKPPEGLVN